MGLRPFIRISPILRIWLLGLIALSAFFLGTSSLSDSFPYYPLIVGGIIPAAIMFLMILLGWLRNPAYALYVTLFVVFLPTGLIPADIHSLLKRSLTIAALASFLIYDFSGVLRAAQSITVLLMVGYLLWSGVSWFWAENIDMGAVTLQAYTMRLILFLVLLVSGIKTEKQMDGLMGILALNGWVLMAASLGWLLLKGYEPGSRFKVIDENENWLGMFALCAMQGVLWHSIKLSTKHQALRKLIGAIYLVMTIGLIGISGSRGTAISIFVTLLAFCFWKPTRSWAKISLIILLLATIVFPFVFTTTVQRFAGTEEDTFLGGREELWQAGWQLIKENPLIGVGIGNSSFEVEGLTRSDWDLEIRSIGKPVHNPLLVVWSETGIVGLFLYLGVLVSAVWSFTHSYLKSRILGIDWLDRYFALVGSVFLGYMASWIKAGGAESDFIYFLLLGLLLIPSTLNIKELRNPNKSQIEKTRNSIPNISRSSEG